MPILTIDSARLNGTPSAGTVRITASRSPLMDSGSNTVYSGTQTFPLDAQGKLSVSLPATDSPSIGPFTYAVEANLASGQWIYRGVKLPASVGTIDITDAQSASQKMYPTRQEWDAITAGMNTAIAGKVTGAGMTLRRDTTVGTRVLLDHPGGPTMLHGDTGWRDITSMLTSGWTATSLQIRRVSNAVTVQWAGLTASTGATIGVSDIPAGFRARSPKTIVPATANSVVFSLTHWIQNITVADLAHFSGPRDGSATWLTSNAWPTTLPGEPA